MYKKDLRKAIAGVTQNKRIRAIALEVIGGRASVKISGSSQLLYGVPIVGGDIIAGQEVYVDYTTGQPVVHSYAQADLSDVSVSRVKTRVIIPDPDVPNSGADHTHTESQITDLVHSATKIRGRTITTGSPTDGDTLLWDETSGSWVYGAGGEVDEAPIDGKQYARSDGDWVEISSGSSITDHSELTGIGTNTHDQIDTALTRLAGTSGSNTGDQDLSSYLTDANSDGKIYGRKDGEWAEVTSSGSGGGIEEAPIDGEQYVRQDGEWVVASGGNITLQETSSGSLLTVSGLVLPELSMEDLEDGTAKLLFYGVNRFHYDADLDITLDPTNVSKWGSQTAYAGTMVQATAANRPTVVESAVNSLPAIRFDGTNDYLLTTYPVCASEFTIIIVCAPKFSAAKGIFSIADSTASAQPLLVMGIQDASYIRYYVNGNYNITNIPAPTNEFKIHTLRFSGIDWGASVNGSSETVYTGGTKYAAGNLCFATAYGGVCQVDIAEFKMYEKYLSDTQLALIVNGLKSKYGIT